jgi:tripartite-type tricarboxylate transporter receptor subunit TctC
VSLVASGTFVLVVNRSSPVTSVRELVALAKSKPAQLSYSSSGVGGPLHLAGELLKSRAGIQMLHVPYGGGAPAIAAVTAGEVQVGFGSMTAALPLIKAGRVTALAVTSAKRAKSFPELPTIAESGVPGYDVTPTYGILAPAGTTSAIAGLLNGAINKILQSADVHAKFATLGLEATGSTPEAFRQVMQAEIVQSARVIKDANIKTE